MREKYISFARDLKQNVEYNEINSFALIVENCSF